VFKGLAKIGAVIAAATLFGLVMLYYRHGTIFPKLDAPPPEKEPTFFVRLPRLS
jgi:hypothetical protein